jgi:hypothetical protein
MVATKDSEQQPNIKGDNIFPSPLLELTMPMYETYYAWG